DWVIDALNRDLPFDQFTIEQLAGDLLPNATVGQKIATGFNRAVPTNVEAGADQEETRVNQVFDRVNTLGSVWLGSTLECAQCHNHKYDPITQKEYYQLFAFFNNTPKETDFRTPNSTASLRFVGPYMSLPDEETEKQRVSLLQKIDQLKADIEKRSTVLAGSQDSWEKELLERSWEVGRLHLLEVAEFDAESGSLHKVLEDQSILLIKDENGATPSRDTYTVTVHSRLTGITGFKLEALTDPSLPGNGPGRGDARLPNFVLNDFSVTIAPEGGTGAKIKLRNASASFSQQNFPVSAAIDDNPRSGWAIRPEFAKDHWAIFQTTAPIGSTNSSSLLTFKLEQTSGQGRSIGRLRLSAFTGPVDERA
ncbi:MAG: DUF1549 domain-containing protein, partial [Limisphaerales bacterium]